MASWNEQIALLFGMYLPAVKAREPFTVCSIFFFKAITLNVILNIIQVKRKSGVLQHVCSFNITQQLCLLSWAHLLFGLCFYAAVIRRGFFVFVQGDLARKKIYPTLW